MSESVNVKTLKEEMVQEELTPIFIERICDRFWERKTYVGLRATSDYGSSIRTVACKQLKK